MRACPAPLKPGDLVDIVAPASAFNRLEFYRGAGWLAGHFRVRFRRASFAREGPTAGSVLHRARDLQRALLCTESRAVVAARGGVGCTDLLPLLDLRFGQRSPKWIVGYSDVTAIHLLAQKLGLPSLHAHNVTGLGPADESARWQWLDALHNPMARRVFPVQEILPGALSGSLVGGNLAVLVASLRVLGVDWLQGKVLFLEEIAEPPYRLHRLLRELESSGALDLIEGIVVGHLTACGPKVAALREFKELCESQSLPLYSDLPCGHERPNAPLVLGLQATVVGRELVLLPSATPSA